MRELFLDPLVASGAVTVDFDIGLVAHFVLFSLFIIVMKPLIFDPLIKVFEERERQTAGAVKEAREMDEQAIELKREYDGKFDEIRREANIERERLRGESAKLEAEMMGSAREVADTSLEEGQGKIHTEIDAIRSDLEAQQPALAAEIASRVLGREVK